jgi:hypothetical protein
MYRIREYAFCCVGVVVTETNPEMSTSAARYRLRGDGCGLWLPRGMRRTLIEKCEKR